MPHTARSKTLIGYHHGQIPPGANSFPATAVIDGVEVMHQLSICVEPVTAIDLGRSIDGDLVWVSEHVEPAGVQPVTPSIFRPLEFSPLEPDPTVESVKSEELWEPQSQHIALVGKYRKPLLFAAGAVVVVVSIGLLLPAKSASSQVTDIPSAPSKEVIAEDVKDTNTKPTDPASAAIDFVLNGEVEGIDVEPGAQASDFQANVVSQSGEIVLVDVLRNEASGLTTFATLLLQKSGTAWRIREVFDPR